MARQYRSPVLWRATVAAGRRKRRRSAGWLWPIVAPVGLGLVATAGFAVLGGPSWADPQVVTPSGLPVQVHPTFPEPGLPAYSFPAGGGTLLGGSVGSGDPGGSGTVGGDVGRLGGSAVVDPGVRLSAICRVLLRCEPGVRVLDALLRSVFAALEPMAAGRVGAGSDGYSRGNANRDVQLQRRVWSA